VLLGDADRELLYEKLKRHAAAGRLGIEELERRVAAVAMAETMEDAARVMADLPPLAAEEPPPRLRSRRGHGEVPAPAADWQPTNERFRDPGSNSVMRVWVDTAGGRHYVAE
jgi:Domain of unknown function (DUF1707)